MSISSTDLFSNSEVVSADYGLLHKEHRIVEFDVWVGKDQHLLPMNIEGAMYELGFTQRTIKVTHHIKAINGIDKLEFKQFNGVFDHPKGFEVVFQFAKKDKYRMLVFPHQNTQLTIDDGAEYYFEDGLIRLKDLL